MKRYFALVITIVICINLSACFGSAGQGSLQPDNAVLKEVDPIDAFSSQLTDEFVKKYNEIDNEGCYNQQTDKIIVNYIGKSQAFPNEEQYEIKYYSVRNTEGAEIGYIGACIEETAWSLWGCYKTAIKPLVFSGYQYDDNKKPTHRCLYGFGYTNNLSPDEYGNVYPYEKFRAQTYSEISVSAGYALWVELGGKTAVDVWQENEKQIVFDKYIETRQHINKDASTLIQTPNTSEKNEFASFVEGNWCDLYSQRCNLNMDVVNNETVQIEINWSSGAAYNTVWNFTGKWDSNTGRLNYENGVMFDYEYVEGQEEAKIIGFYFDGTGYFYFEDGYLYWVDHKENAGANCYFEQSSE